MYPVGAVKTSLSVAQVRVSDPIVISISPLTQAEEKHLKSYVQVVDPPLVTISAIKQCESGPNSSPVTAA